MNHDAKTQGFGSRLNIPNRGRLFFFLVPDKGRRTFSLRRYTSMDSYTFNQSENNVAFFLRIKRSPVFGKEIRHHRPCYFQHAALPLGRNICF